MDPQKYKFSMSDVGYFPSNFTHEEVYCRLHKQPMPIVQSAYRAPVVAHGKENYVEQVKTAIRFPLMCPELYQQTGASYPRGFILYGPPGNGKTQFSRVIKYLCEPAEKVAFFSVIGSTILEGDASTSVRKLFDAACELSPSVVYIDEADGLLRKRNKDSGVVLTLLSLLDGPLASKHVITLASTNDRAAIDIALRRPGRFEVEFHFKRPNLAERQMHLTRFTRGWHGVDQAMVDDAADETKGYSIVDLRSMCSKALHLAFKRVNPQTINADIASWTPFTLQYVITPADFDRALQDSKPSCRK